jgi:hypothetical protein
LGVVARITSRSSVPALGQRGNDHLAQLVTGEVVPQDGHLRKRALWDHRTHQYHRDRLLS